MKKITIFVLISSLMWSVSAFGETAIFDFSSGMGPNFAFTSIPDGKFTLNDGGGNLRIQDAYDWIGWGVWGGYVNSNFYLVGDFDISVEYSINTSSLGSGIQIQLDLPDIHLVRSNEGGDNYHVFYGGWISPVSTSDRSGYLRFKREGSTLKASAPGFLWQTGYYTTDPIKFGVCAQPNSYGGYNGSSPVDISFDNFRITADELRGYIPPTPTTEPVSVFLLGFGLCGLAGLRRMTQKFHGQQ